MKGEITSVVMDRQQAKLLDVLLIEDNPIDARLVSRLLRSPSEALKCRHVSTLAEATQLLKAVAFDVYKAVGGSERTRVLTMKLLRVGFVLGMTVQMIFSLLGDRATYRRGNLVSSWRRLRRSPLLSRELWDQLRDFDRPDFHPDDRDTTELVERWRTELFGDEGALNAQLVGRAV